MYPPCLRALLLLGRSTAKAALRVALLFLTLCTGLHSAAFAALRCDRASSTSIQSLTLWICGCTGLHSSRLSIIYQSQS